MALTIHIPKRIRHKNHYVSPFTQSLSLSISPGAACATCSGPMSRNIGLTPSSPNCTGLNNGTTCTIILVLNPGNYIGSISTYDGAVGCQASNACNTLSSNQSFPLPIASGRANAPSIALYGVPKYLSVMPVSSNVNVLNPGIGDASDVYVAGVDAKATVSLYAVDADQSLILGPGSPSFSLPSPATLGWSATVRGNLLTFATGATFQPKSFALEPFPITAVSPACSTVGATCAFGANLFVAPLLAVADSTNGEVHVYMPDPPRNRLTTYATVTTGVSVPTDVKFSDVNGDLFVSNALSKTVTVYAPPYTGAPIKTISVPIFPTHIALDKDGDLAVASTFLIEQVNVYAAPGYGSPQTISLSNFATALTFEYFSSPALWVASSGSVARYAYPYSGAASPNLSIGHPAGIDLDPMGNPYVADSTAGTLTQYLASSAYSVGVSTGSLPQASSVSAGALLNVCAAHDEFSYLYGGGTMQVANATNTASASPCLITSDYSNDILFAAAQSTSTYIFAQEDSLQVSLPFLVDAIAAYPSGRFVQ